MTWATIILQLLKLFNVLVGEVQKRGYIKEGEDAQIAREALALVRMTQWAKSLRDNVDAQTADELDALIDRLPFGARMRNYRGRSGGSRRRQLLRRVRKSHKGRSRRRRNQKARRRY